MRFLSIVLLAVSLSAEQLPYPKPSLAILDILDAPVLPALAVNPTRTYATLSEQSRYPSITEVSQPMLRLAGIRINPKTNGLHLSGFSKSIELVKLPEGTKTPVILPGGARASEVRWSPDGKQFAFMNTTDSGMTSPSTTVPNANINPGTGQKYDPSNLNDLNNPNNPANRK